MFNASEYYQKVNDELFCKNDNLFRPHLRSYENEIEIARKLYNGTWNQELLKAITIHYGFNMDRVYLDNYVFLNHWEKEILHFENKTADFEPALMYIVFCCLADKLLDSKRFSTDEKVRFLPVIKEPLKHNEEQNIEYSDFLTLKDLYSKQISNIADSILKEEIIDLIVRAFKSECFISTNFLSQKLVAVKPTISELTDKSVCFEKAALLLMLNKSNETLNHLSTLIAQTFWLIDDLNDFVEDVNNRRLNSLLFLDDKASAYNVEEIVYSGFQSTSLAVERLLESLAQLEIEASPALADYVITKVWLWGETIRENGKLAKR